MNHFVIRCTQIELPEETLGCDLVIEDGIIQSIDPYGSNLEHDSVHNFGDLVVLPGLIDSHVHLNAPGRSEWEGFESGTRAAKAGGITTLVDMPLNSSPVTTSVAALDAKRKETHGKLHVDIAFHAGVVPQSVSDVADVVHAGAVAAKAFLCHSGLDEFPNVAVDDLRMVMPELKALEVPLLVHAELVHLVPEMKDPRCYADYLATRPRSFERRAIELLIELASETGCHVHIVHLADGESIRPIAAAKHSGIPITVETCPHYLCIDIDEIEAGQTQFKCAPPIRGRADREALWEGLADGTIDMIVSDHSPCPPSMKCLESGRFDQAWGGISSLQIGLPLIWTEAKRRGFAIRDVVRWMSVEPANLLGLKHGIKVGEAAMLCVFDPNETWVIDQNDLHHRHPISPYHGRQVKGRVVQTFVHGCIDDEPRGRLR